MPISDDEITLHIEDELRHATYYALAHRLLRGETITVEVERTGERFTIVPGMSYGLHHYAVVRNGTVERDGMILARRAVEDWCVGLREVKE